MIVKPDNVPPKALWEESWHRFERGAGTRPKDNDRKDRAQRMEAGAWQGSWKGLTEKTLGILTSGTQAVDV